MTIFSNLIVLAKASLPMYTFINLCISSCRIEEVAFSFNGGKDSTVSFSLCNLLSFNRIFEFNNNDVEIWRVGIVAPT